MKIIDTVTKSEILNALENDVSIGFFQHIADFADTFNGRFCANYYLYHSKNKQIINDEFYRDDNGAFISDSFNRHIGALIAFNFSGRWNRILEWIASYDGTDIINEYSEQKVFQHGKEISTHREFEGDTNAEYNDSNSTNIDNSVYGFNSVTEVAESSADDVSTSNGTSKNTSSNSEDRNTKNTGSDSEQIKGRKSPVSKIVIDEIDRDKYLLIQYIIYKDIDSLITKQIY